MRYDCAAKNCHLKRPFAVKKSREDGKCAITGTIVARTYPFLP